MKKDMELISMCGEIMIYGAKSIALGVCCAVRELFPEKRILGFLVSSRENNPEKLYGLPVMSICDYSRQYSDDRDEHYSKDKITVLIGTPEMLHGEIIRTLESFGFSRYICIDWELEELLMERYYSKNSKFPSLHLLESPPEREDHVQNRLCVFQVKSHKDIFVKGTDRKRAWLHTIHAGAAQGSDGRAEYFDNTGDHISAKNSNYCELTALYWIWKNVLDKEEAACEYYGMFQYRRLLNIEEEDIKRIARHQADVILPFPTMHEPDIREHHERYIAEEDWDAMVTALYEKEPEYAEDFQGILNQPYLYNYNILIAKKSILRDYCAWLFPILERTEELSRPRGWERSDRYIGYMGENLLTLYFMRHKEEFRIVHTGRIMLV